MYNPINKHFLFRQSTGKVWNFYHDTRLGICHSFLNKRNSWSEPISIQKSHMPPFYIDMDFEDTFHLLFQDTHGNVFYSSLSNNNIKTMPILNSKSPSRYNKHLYLIPFKNNVHAFYILAHNNSSLLIHQTISQDNVSAPVVIDYIINNDSPYSVLTDISGNIYIFYHIPSGKYNHIGYKKYSSSNKAWETFTGITTSDNICNYPKTLIDNKDIIHICYQREEENKFELIYRQKIPERDLWTNEIIIQSSQFPLTPFSIIHVKNNIIIFWIRENNIYFSSSKDSGISWSTPSKQLFTYNSQLLCMCFKTNNPYESEHIHTKEIPGSYINGFRLAFYQNNSDSENMTPDEIKNVIIDGLRLIKGNVEDLRDSDSSLQNKFNTLSTSYNHLNMEVSKLSVKITLIENQIKQFQSRLDSLEKKEIPDKIENNE